MTGAVHLVLAILPAEKNRTSQAGRRGYYLAVAQNWERIRLM